MMLDPGLKTPCFQTLMVENDTIAFNLKPVFFLSLRATTSWVHQVVVGYLGDGRWWRR